MEPLDGTACIFRAVLSARSEWQSWSGPTAMLTSWSPRSSFYVEFGTWSTGFGVTTANSWQHHCNHGLQMTTMPKIEVGYLLLLYQFSYNGGGVVVMAMCCSKAFDAFPPWPWMPWWPLHDVGRRLTVAVGLWYTTQEVSEMVLGWKLLSIQW